jgi:hypothetical protein
VGENVLHNTTYLEKKKTMYVQRYIAARLRNGYCHGNARTRSHFIVVTVNVAVNNIKVFSVANEMQQWVPTALLRAAKYFVLPLTVSIKHYECASVFLP